jgi:hypothetical protein
MDTPTFAWRLFELLSPIALVGLSWLSMKAAQLLTAKVKSEHMTRVLLLVDDVVLAAAREVQQVLVDKLKVASPGGELTPEQGAQAKHAALDSAKSQLGAQGLADITETFGLEPGAVERMLGTRIEAAVHRLKTRARAASDPGTAGDAVPFAA